MDVNQTRQAVREATAKCLYDIRRKVNYPGTDWFWEIEWEDLRIDDPLTKSEAKLKARYYGYADDLLKVLSSLGVVIEGEGELPENPIIQEDGYMLAWNCYNNGQQDMLKAGYRQTYELEGT